MTRYNKNTIGLRIFTGRTQNWLSGFWGNLQGVAFHEGWLTNSTYNFYPYPAGSGVAPTASPRWLLSSDQNSLYGSLTMDHSLFGTVNFGPAGLYGPTYDPQICLNRQDQEPSEWSNQIALVYNRTLSIKEIHQVEDYLATRYKVDIPIQEGLALSLDAADFLPVLTSLSWKDRSRYTQNFNLANSVQYVGNSKQFQYMDCTSYGTTFASATDVSFSTPHKTLS